MGWAISQNIEVVGGGVVAVFYGEGGLTANQLSNVLTFFILILIGICCVLNLYAFYKYSRMVLFPLSVVVWLLPGMWNLMSPENFSEWWFVPERFVTGGGISYMPVGTFHGAIYSVVFSLLFGWSFFSITQNTNFLRDKFKFLLDHLWYPIGIVFAMTFLVETNDAGRINSEYEEKYSEVMMVSHELENQIEYIIDYLKVKEDIDGALMRVFESTKFYLEYKLPGQRFFYELSSASEVFGDGVREFSKINLSICRGEQINKFCRVFPSQVGVVIGQKLQMGWEEIDAPRLIFAHKIIDYVRAVSKELALLNEKKRDIQKLDSYRWFSILLLAFVAGGKTAVASRGLFQRLG